MHPKLKKPTYAAALNDQSVLDGLLDPATAGGSQLLKLARDFIAPQSDIRQLAADFAAPGALDRAADMFWGGPESGNELEAISPTWALTAGLNRARESDVELPNPAHLRSAPDIYLFLMNFILPLEISPLCRPTAAQLEMGKADLGLRGRLLNMMKLDIQRLSIQLNDLRISTCPVEKEVFSLRAQGDCRGAMNAIHKISTRKKLLTIQFDFESIFETRHIQRTIHYLQWYKLMVMPARFSKLLSDEMPRVEAIQNWFDWCDEKGQNLRALAEPGVRALIDGHMSPRPKDKGNKKKIHKAAKRALDVAVDEIAPHDGAKLALARNLAPNLLKMITAANSEAPKISVSIKRLLKLQQEACRLSRENIGLPAERDFGQIQLFTAWSGVLSAKALIMAAVMTTIRKSLVMRSEAEIVSMAHIRDPGFNARFASKIKLHKIHQGQISDQHMPRNDALWTLARDLTESMIDGLGPWSNREVHEEAAAARKFLHRCLSKCTRNAFRLANDQPFKNGKDYRDWMESNLFLSLLVSKTGRY